MHENVSDAPTPSQPWQLAVRLAIRVVASIVVLLAAYYVLPLDRTLDGAFVATLVVALVLVAGVAAVETRAILRSPLPRMKALEALTTVVPLLLLVFAAGYYLVAQSNPTSFTEPLSRTDSLYFTVTVFSTVGFGDISAASEGSRLLVTFNIAVNLVVVGLGLRVILGAVKRGREQR